MQNFALRLKKCFDAKGGNLEKCFESTINFILNYSISVHFQNNI